MNTNTYLKSIVSACVLGLSLAACTGNGTTDTAAGGAVEYATARLSLAKGSICPFPGGLTGLFWWIQMHGSNKLVTIGVTPQEIDAYCAGSTQFLKSVHLYPGNYEVVMQAKDASGKAINDIEATYDAFAVTNVDVSLSGAFKAAAEPKSLGDNPTPGSDGLETFGDLVCGLNPAIGEGCCCPASCKSESVVGCARATRNGFCTGWTNPCGC